MKKIFVLILLVLLVGCNNMSKNNKKEDDLIVKEKEAILVIEVNGNILYAELEDNTSAEKLVEMLDNNPIEIDMEDYGDFEKVGSLPFSLPRNDTSITTSPGDIILYQGDHLCIYYGTNTWSFTKLAKINDIDKKTLLDILGNDEVKVKLYIEYK